MRRGRMRGSLGPFAMSALALAERRAVTFSDVQFELGLSRSHAQDVVYELRRRGMAVRVGSVAVTGSVRPAVQIRAASAVARQECSLSGERIDMLLTVV